MPNLIGLKNEILIGKTQFIAPWEQVEVVKDDRKTNLLKQLQTETKAKEGSNVSIEYFRE